jgi:hypothetical protein
MRPLEKKSSIFRPDGYMNVSIIHACLILTDLSAGINSIHLNDDR